MARNEVRPDPGIQQRRYRLAAEDRFVRLRLSARAIKTIDKIGGASSVRTGAG
ncbi:bL28 family ribosomal protein [Nonomuraea sp. NPDC049419]|uniref:bL28 family ribosomal protein n=1 Tax=Nonomuraea sp. NPDC049419 TaxID=3155772 RepID=UPI003426F401